jgi:hypothetical protein
MNSQLIAIEMSPEVASALSQNSVDLLQELKASGLDIERAARPTSFPPRVEGTKSIELIILASAAAAPLVSAAIVRVIDAIARAKGKKTQISPSENPHTTNNTASSHQITVSFLGLKVELVDKYNG